MFELTFGTDRSLGWFLRFVSAGEFLPLINQGLKRKEYQKTETQLPNFFRKGEILSN